MIPWSYHGRKSIDCWTCRKVVKSPRLKMTQWVEALAEQVGGAECKSPAPTRNVRSGCICLQSLLQDVWRRKCGWSFPICLPHSRFSEKHCFQRNTMDRDKIGHQTFTGLLASNVHWSPRMHTINPVSRKHNFSHTHIHKCVYMLLTATVSLSS